MKRMFRYSICFPCMLLLPVLAMAQGIELSLDEARLLALKDNPGLAQIRARYEALSQVPSQVGTLPDPVITLGAMNLPTDSFDRDQEPMTQLQIGVTQQFPFPGKLSLREKAAELEARAVASSVSEMKLDLAGEVAMKWWQVFYLDRAQDTVRSNQSLLRQFIQVARKKYEVGDGLQQDVLLAQLELSRLLEQEIQIRALRRDQAVQLNVLMGRAGDAAITLPDMVSTELSDIKSEQALYEQAWTERPLIEEKQVQIEAARTRLDLAEREYYPDFRLGATYGDRTGRNPAPRNDERSDFLSVMLGVSIPVFYKARQSSAVQQRHSELAGRRYAFEDTRNRIQGEISTAVTAYEQSRESFMLYKTGILPPARQTVSSMLAGYQVNQVDFLNLVRSQVTLFNYELQYWKALTQARQALARLNHAVGGGPVHE